MRGQLYLFPLLLLLAACSSPEPQTEKEVEQETIRAEDPNFTCEELPTSFSSYQEALRQVNAVDFPISESVNTSSSSWIRSAKYYSCDEQTGYLIIGTDKQDYIHLHVPLQVWKDFRSASSFGSYYTRNIKGRYR